MDDTDKLLGRLEELRTKHKELDKHIKKLYNTQIKDKCKKPISNVSECFEQVVKVTGNVIGNTATIINTADKPSGCFFIKNDN